MIVNFGCGPTGRTGYLNIDGGPVVLISKLPVPSKLFRSRAGLIEGYRSAAVTYRTATRLRFAPVSLDGFYASHVFEHMDPDELAELLSKIAIWLKHGAWLRVVLPDLKNIADAYTSGAIQGDTFIKRLNLSTAGQGILARLFGRSRHRWMYDRHTFSDLLFSCGFNEVVLCDFGQGADRRLASLDDFGHAHESFYLESRRSIEA
jgi:hypothetical protein